MENKSINIYSHHAPKMDWFEQFFDKMDEFKDDNTLGSQMLKFFKTFLRHAGLMEKDMVTPLAVQLKEMGLEDERVWGILLTNLAYSAQIRWYLYNTMMYTENERSMLEMRMVETGTKESYTNDVISSLGRFAELPFNKIGFGTATKEKSKIVGFSRSEWQNPDPLVILYSLYKYAEACGGYYHFTLSALMDESIESDGVSPARIFGLSRETLGDVLQKLSANHQDFINASFTLGLDNINLKEDKTSADVLALFN